MEPYLKDVSHSRLVIDGLFEHSVLIYSNGGKYIQNRGVHRPKAIGDQGDDDPLPAR